MKAVQILKKRSKLSLGNIPIPKRLPHQVLVEVHYAPIHPADLATMTGSYPYKDSLAVLGLEASGIIREAPDQSLIGKKVGCYSKNGSWCEYIVPTLYNVLPDDIDLETASCLTVNPLTALAMRKLTLGKSFIINSANSSISMMLIKVAYNQAPICIVRSSVAKEMLQQIGVKYILNSNSLGFKQELREAVEGNPCFCGFDFIGGANTATILKSIGKDSSVYVVGNLGAESIGDIDSKEIIFNRKKIEGLHLDSYIASASEFFKEINSNPEPFYSKISEVVELEKYSEGVMKYAKKMSDGKILLKIK